MRFSYRFLLMLFPALAAVLLGFFAVMDRIETRRVTAELRQRAGLIKNSVEGALVVHDQERTGSVQKLLDRVNQASPAVGLAVCGVDGKRLLARSGPIPPGLNCEALRNAPADADGYTTLLGTPQYRSLFPLSDEENNRRGFLLILQSPLAASSTPGLLMSRNALVALAVLVFLLGFVTMLVHQWSVSQRLEEVSRGLKGLVRGDISQFSKMLRSRTFRPLVDDLERVLMALRRAKGEAPAPDAANVWTPARLRGLVERLFGDSRLCVVANREPYIHNRKGKQIQTVFPASGLVTAVEPIVRACSGLWIGHGSGSADRETADKKGVILVPPGNPEYALKRVWLTKEEEKGYYYGFANEGLWPLCHIAHTRPLFRIDDWNHYRNANAKFADAFVEEMGGPAAPVALIQDYHFAMLPRMVRKKRPDAVLSLFWHIPWPNPESFQICPWKNELLDGMLGSDLIGFHTQFHCNNFLDTVDRFLEARVDRENFSVTVRGHTTFVRPFPIGVEWPPKHDAPAEDVPGIRRALLDELNLPHNSYVGVGVDRLDYTKGIVERLLAVERLLDRDPELVGRFVFIQISAPSRTSIKRYQELDLEVRETAERINFRFRRPGYEPILLRLQHHDSEEVFRYYRAADVCLVTSLHDGMNLVAKEYVSARSDNGGALVLSSFTGAAREMNEAFIVNPYDIEASAAAIHQALRMPERERRDRMERLRQGVATRNAYAWAGSLLEEVHRVAELRRHQETVNPEGRSQPRTRALVAGWTEPYYGSA